MRLKFAGVCYRDTSAARSGRMDGCLVYVRRIDAFFETRPVLKCIWITAIFFPLVAAVAMIEPLIAARVSVRIAVYLREREGEIDFSSENFFDLLNCTVL